MSPSAYDRLPNRLTTAASVAGFLVFLKNFSGEIIPSTITSYFSDSFLKVFRRISSQLVVVIQESEGLTSNQMFSAANLYLGARISPWTQRIRVNKPEKDAELEVTIDKNQEIVDVHSGIKFTWVLHSSPIKASALSSKSTIPKTEIQYFELYFPKKRREFALKVYLPHILKRAKEIEAENREVRLHTVDYSGTDYWGSVPMNHPATFDTMAMDFDVKKELIEDLDRFLQGKDFYRRVGRAWKRGYLFYGPPGTGKSSLIAAMANYLKFDVYDLDLREVQCNSDLRRLLIGSASRSILVIEDIDCNVGLRNREIDNPIPEEDKITLSGLLNFIDGLWSSCGDERIIVFTTNHKDRLDPALLRPGRMDVQLEMSYCSYEGFKILAWNYLRIEEHPTFAEVQDLLQKVESTPAEVAGELIKSTDAGIALRRLVEFLEKKKGRN